MKKNDTILAGSLLLLGSLIFLGVHVQKKPGASVTVTVDQRLFGTYSLFKDQDISVEGGNRLRISDGKAWMEWADCPDELCIHQGKISRTGETIVCLPNRVVAEVTGDSSREVDSIAE